MCRVLLTPQKRKALEEIGRECKRIRTSCGYTQKQVAEEVGDHPVNISTFESGHNNSATILNWYIEHGYRGLR